MIEIEIIPEVASQIREIHLKHGWNASLYSILVHAYRNFHNAKGHVQWRLVKEQIPESYAVLTSAHSLLKCQQTITRWRNSPQWKAILNEEPLVEIPKRHRKAKAKKEIKAVEGKQEEEQVKVDVFNFCPHCGISLKVFKAAANYMNKR